MIVGGILFPQGWGEGIWASPPKSPSIWLHGGFPSQEDPGNS